MESTTPTFPAMLESSTTLAKQDSDSYTRTLTDFNRFLEYMPAAIAMFDLQRCCLLASQRWREDFGVEEGNMMVGSFAQNHWQEIQSNSLAGAVSIWEEAVVYADGTNQWVKWEVQPWYDEFGEIGGEIIEAWAITDRKNAEEFLQQLLQELEYLKLAIDHTSIVSTTDLQGNITHVNDLFGKISQYSRAELLGQNPRILNSGYHPPKFFKQLWSKISRGMVWQGEMKNLAKDGTFYWVETTIVPCLDSQGKLYQYIAISNDVSDRKRTEMALAESEARFRQFVENANDLIYSIAEDGSFIYLSPQFSKMFGYEVDEWQGKSFAHLVHPQDLPKVIAANQQLFETGERQAGLEFRVQHGNGSWVWMVCNNSPIQDAEDRVIGFHGIGRDITDRKAVEAALAESEAKFRHLVEGANDLIYTTSLDAVFTYVAPQVTEILGYYPSEIMGQSIALFTHPDDISIAAAFNQSIVETGEPRAGMEIRAKRKDGSWCWITCNNSPIKDANGNIVGIQGIARDISDRKAAEFQLQQQAEKLENAFQELKQTQAQMLQSEKMSSLGQMVAGVAHEINNPVNFIHGNLTHAENYFQDLLDLLELYQQYYRQPVAEIEIKTEEIELDFLVEDLTKMFQSMRVGTERIREIVLSLRNFSRLDESDCKESDLHQGLDSTLMILQNRLKPAPICVKDEQYTRPAIEVVRKYGNVPLIECYPGQLNQVFMNILTNAIDAIEDRDKTRSWEDIHQNSGQISIETERVNSTTARIRIQDNGIGIPAAIQNRIFDPFFTTKDVGKGTGLGMSISYQIITDRHQGSISCISSPGKGTEFIVEIPIRHSNSSH
jgi:PAS domain S-box-containing protein